jgi:ubiquinone/menaquinone biosynthesis C-methylase UbiE
MVTSTDLFWENRTSKEQDITKVNIADLAQRKLETEFLLEHLKPTDSILEVGCGNGYLTNTLRQHVKHVDAFDYSKQMVKSALEHFKETNNHFFHDNLLQPTQITKMYDAIICVRVLINLADLHQQFQALDNLKKVLNPGGRLILIEGYIDGFNSINRFRNTVSLPPLTPAAINFYSQYSEISHYLENDYDIQAEFHTGCFDFLTRIVYPSLVGSENAQGYNEFHEKTLDIAKHFNPEAMKEFARLRGECLVKR